MYNREESLPRHSTHLPSILRAKPELIHPSASNCTPLHPVSKSWKWVGDGKEDGGQAVGEEGDCSGYMEEENEEPEDRDHNINILEN
jgi:hypothetical protein